MDEPGDPLPPHQPQKMIPVGNAGGGVPNGNVTRLRCRPTATGGGEKEFGRDGIAGRAQPRRGIMMDGGRAVRGMALYRHPVYRHRLNNQSILYAAAVPVLRIFPSAQCRDPASPAIRGPVFGATAGFKPEQPFA